MEAMVTVAIALIIMAIGAPAMSNWISSAQVRTQASTLSGLLRTARAEAVNRNISMTLATASGNTNWSAEISLYVDVSGGDSAFTSDDGDQLVRVIDLSGGRPTSTSNAAGSEFISFGRDGRLTSGGAVIIAVCDERGEADGYRIDINLVGRVTERKGAGDCTP